MKKPYTKYIFTSLALLIILFCMTLFIDTLRIQEKPSPIPVAIYPDFKEYKKTITYQSRLSYDWYNITFDVNETPEEVYAFYSKEMPVYNWEQDAFSNTSLHEQKFYQPEPGSYNSGNHFITIKATRENDNRTHVTITYSYMDS